MPHCTSISIFNDNSPSESLLPLSQNKKPTILTDFENVYFNSLLDILQNGIDEDFLKEYNSTDLLKNNNDIQIKLFIKAIIDKNRSEDVIEKILCNITDIYYIKELGDSRVYKTTIIEDICWLGSLGAFRKLLNSKHLQLPRTIDILKTIIYSLDEDLFGLWFDILLYVFEEFDVNEDNGNKTPLDIAYSIGKKTVIRKLLEAGTYIGTGSFFEQSNSVDKCTLDPQIIKECFDTCIDGELTDLCAHKYISFNYKNLVPPKTDRNLNDMTPIMRIINSKEHLHLLKHPLITSFMALKWQRLSKFLYVNLIFYCFYLISIVSYIVLTTCNKEIEVLTTCSKEESVFTNLTWWLTIFGTTFLIIREAIQLRFPKEYLKKISNYLELLLIIFSIWIITVQSPDKEIVVFGIILIAIEFWIIFGNVPILSFSTHMLMLEEVLETFLKSFSVYAIFVFTFALCFFVLFGTKQKFDSLFQSFFTTMAMVVGELNFNDLTLESYCSYGLIFLFIICMTVVLMNLLNGLAVSDIQAIRQQAELNELICRAKFLNNHYSKLFPIPNHDSGDKKKEEEENERCNCKYYVSGVYLTDKVFSNKIILPHKCLLCQINYWSKKNENTAKWNWFQFFEEKILWQTFDLWMGNRTVMESSIVEAKTIIRNKEGALSHEKSIRSTEYQLKSLEQTVTNIENKAELMEEKVQDIYQESLIIEKNVQNIESQIQSIEQRVENIGKNVEKILKIMQ